MSDSVIEYELLYAPIYFQKDKVCCDFCPLFETYSRKQCRRTGEYIVHSNIPGGMCPLVTKEEI